MKRSLILFVLLIVSSVAGDRIHSLYSDHRAVRQGDILTVVVVEDAQAGSKSSTETEKNNGVDVKGGGGSGLLDFIPSFGANAGTGISYDGQGGTSRQRNLTAKISAKVVGVRDNGNLVIEGNKVVEINEEKEIIKISGLVRPEDVESNNTVFSYDIADADIKYSGKGVPDDGRRPGLLARFFNWLF